MSSRADEIAKEIELAVTLGKVRANDFLGTKDDLQRRFNVARGTLNEAIRLLQSRAVVKVRPGVGGGISIAEMQPEMRFGNLMLRLQSTAAFTEECFQVRGVLDPAIAADAARHRTESDVADLNAILDEMARTPPDGMPSMLVNWKLHRRIAQISPNMVMRSLYLCLMDVVREQLKEVIGQVGDSAARLDIHMNLVRAIAAGDPSAASYWGGERHWFQRPVGASR